MINFAFYKIDCHGDSGLVSVSEGSTTQKLSEVFLDAAHELNLPIRDVNAEEQIGELYSCLYTKKKEPKQL